MFGNKYKYRKIPKEESIGMATRTRKKGIVIEHIYKNEKNHRNLQNKTLINPLGNFYRRRKSSVVTPNLGKGEITHENSATENILEKVAEALKDSKENICENNVRAGKFPVHQEEFDDGHKEGNDHAAYPVNPWVRRSVSEKGKEDFIAHSVNGKPRKKYL